MPRGDRYMEPMIDIKEFLIELDAMMKQPIPLVDEQPQLQATLLFIAYAINKVKSEDRMMFLSGIMYHCQARMEHGL